MMRTIDSPRCCPFAAASLGRCVARGLAGYAQAFAAVLFPLVPVWAAGQGRPTVFRNTGPSVAYVGSASCGQSGCHEEINRGYAPSPHGQSMTAANTASDLARVPQLVTVFNPRDNRYYTVWQQNGELYQGAYELDRSGRKIFDVAHRIDWLSGGESVGYTYLYKIGPWIFQAPLSYYTHTRTWELSPGYAADDVGFSRRITTGCLVCHNGQPSPVPNREGAYQDPPFRFNEPGVSCESCHGPGALHVAEMQTRKNKALQPGEVDTSIVNPAKLSPRLADDLCRECHQAGDAVALMPGKNYMDYRPGQPLAETMVIVKRVLNPSQRAEADRLETQAPVRGSLEQPLWWKNSTLELSRCYTESHGRLTCSTCHSVHHRPAPGEEHAAYRQACLGCHAVNACKLKPEDPKRVAQQDYCVACHMEKRAIAGIAHSNDTKHRIVRYPGQPLPETAFERADPATPGLLWMNRPEGQAGAAIPDLTLLDAYYTAARRDATLWPNWLATLNRLAKSEPGAPPVLNALGALALASGKDPGKAAEYFSRALKAGSEDLTTYQNLAAALESLGERRQAVAVLERGVEAYPYSASLVGRLAGLYLAEGRPQDARSVVERFEKVFPEDVTIRALEGQLKTAEMAH